MIQSYVDHYNTVRQHSAIAYVTPQDMLTGRQAEIHGARDRKLEQARRQRPLRRQQAAPSLFARFSSVRDGNRIAIPEDYLPKDYVPPSFRLGLLDNLIGTVKGGLKVSGE